MIVLEDPVYGQNQVRKTPYFSTKTGQSLRLFSMTVLSVHTDTYFKVLVRKRKSTMKKSQFLLRKSSNTRP